jgi:hypothetical protein
MAPDPQRLRWQFFASRPELHPQAGREPACGRPGRAAQYSRNIPSFPRTEAVFSFPAHYHTDLIQGRHFNKFTDPMIALMRERYECLKFELDSPLSRKTLPRFEPTVFIDPPKVLQLAKPPARGRQERSGGFDELAGLVRDMAGVVMDEVLFAEQARMAEQYQRFFSNLLGEIRPRFVFIVWYYSLIGMALMWACGASAPVRWTYSTANRACTRHVHRLDPHPRRGIRTAAQVF